MRAHLDTALRRAAAVATAAAGVATAVVVAAAPATAGPSGAVHRGAGAVIAHGTDYVGQYRVTLAGHSEYVYCINPTRRQPARVTLSTVRRVPGLSTTATRELAYVLAAHGQTARRVPAEATSQALNYLAGNRADVARRARYLAASTERLAMSYVAEARRMRGPYTVRLRLPVAALPGQSGTGTVRVAGAGAGVATTVTLTHGANVTTPAAVRTDAHGAARFPYRTTGTGPVRVWAVAGHLPPVTVRVSSPAGGFQRLVGVGAPTGARGSATYQGRATGIAHAYACDSQCDGLPAVTLRACAPAGAYPARITFTWTGSSAVLDFDAARTRVCRSTTLVVPDGRHVSAVWRYRTPKGWTGALAAAGGFTVDCPPAPPVAVAVSYDCTAASVTATLGRQRDGTLVPLRNATRHPYALLVSGAVTGRFTVAPGATSAPHSWPVACGSGAQVTVQAAVQRADGGWNVGRPATVTLP